MGKIYCSKCGTELEDTVKFCSNCGNNLTNNTLPSNIDKDKEIVDNIELLPLGVGILLGFLIMWGASSSHIPFGLLSIIVAPFIHGFMSTVSFKYVIISSIVLGVILTFISSFINTGFYLIGITCITVIFSVIGKFMRIKLNY